MKNINGTPKNLKAAIRDGLQEILGEDYNPALVVALESCVKDFLAQKFTTATMMNQTHVDLWSKIIEKEAA